MKKWSGFHIRWNRKVWTLVGVGLLLCGAVAANILIGAGATGRRGSRPPGRTRTPCRPAHPARRASLPPSAPTATPRAKRRSITSMRSSSRGRTSRRSPTRRLQKLDIVNNMEKELTVESLLKAKGFADAAVTLHAGSVNVILSAESLSEEQVAQVLDIVIRETGEPAENVKVTTAQ